MIVTSRQKLNNNLPETGDPRWDLQKDSRPVRPLVRCYVTLKTPNLLCFVRREKRTGQNYDVVRQIRTRSMELTQTRVTMAADRQQIITRF